jgi:hypothetical protein
MAYTMLCGLLQFEQTQNNTKYNVKYNVQYKPLIDHLTIEIFNALIKITGWSILYPFTTILHNNLKNCDRELIFTHIQTCVVQQLRMDETEPIKASDLCYNLPREKSYKWGWFSYYVAVSYYCKSLKTTPDKMNSKTLRKCMMEYRKLITLLRQSTTKYIEEDLNSIPSALAAALAPDEGEDTMPAEAAAEAASEAAAAAPPRLEENLEKLIIDLYSPEYNWLDKIITNTIKNTEPKNEPVQEKTAPQKDQPVQEEEQEPMQEEPVHIAAADAEIPAEKNKTDSQEPGQQEPGQQEPGQQEPGQYPQGQQPQQSGWFNWLGWS